MKINLDELNAILAVTSTILWFIYYLGWIIVKVIDKFKG